MNQLTKKSKRLDPIIDDRKDVFDDENRKLSEIRSRKLRAIAEMKQAQRDYVSGVERLNNERGTSDRLLLHALETGLDSVKQKWMDFYQVVLNCEREEQLQLEAVGRAYKDLEAIRHLKGKYEVEITKETNRREQKSLDELAL
ncbi:MAG: flagellar FliJ family protein, partial [Proteobacteria bacterium]|nr:flagellar FliJ family protein [Pseudomonadota bacterium]